MVLFGVVNDASGVVIPSAAAAGRCRWGRGVRSWPACSRPSACAPAPPACHRHGATRVREAADGEVAQAAQELAAAAKKGFGTR